MGITVAEVAQRAIGASFRVEGTGGGCEALVATLEGGAHLVICDNLSVPEWGDRDTSVGFYPAGAWDDSAFPATVDEWQDEPLTVHGLERMIHTVMDGVLCSTS